MSPGRWALAAGLLTYLVALAAQTPATWAWHRLSGASAEWGLAGVHGTAWSGGAAELRYRGRALGALRWDARPLALLLGRAEARLRLAAGGHSLVARVGYAPGRGSYLRSLRGSIPAARVIALAGLEGVTVGGRLAAEGMRLAPGTRLPAAAEGRVRWIDAGLGLSRPFALGDLEARLSPADDGARAVLADGGGPLALEGTLVWHADGRYELEARVRARPGAEPGLAGLLEAAGTAGPDGGRRLSVSGRL